MNPPIPFPAPWNTSSRVISALASVLLAGVAVTGWLAGFRPSGGRWAMTVLPLVMLALCALWTVRGYELTANSLGVRRLLWTTRLPLAGLQSASADAAALPGTLRLCGNGGFFSFSRLFWSRRLGRYRLFATDPARAVVLRFARRTVVISPDLPEEFLQALHNVAAAP